MTMNKNLLYDTVNKKYFLISFLDCEEFIERYEEPNNLIDLSVNLKIINNQEMEFFEDLMIKAIVNDLEGTCDFLNDKCDYYGFSEDDLTVAQLSYLDEHILCCDTCGWYSEAGLFSDLTGDSLCPDCQDDEDEEE